MDATEQLSRIRELGKARAKKYYEANKEKLNAKRREQRAKAKEAKAEVPEIKEVKIEVPQMDTPKIKEVKKTSKKGPINGKDYTWNDILGAPQVQFKKVEPIVIERPLPLKTVQQKIKELNLKPSNEKKYSDDIKRVMKMLQCDDLNTCLSNPSAVIQKINDAKMRNGDPYSINTKKSAYQSILFVIDQLKLKVDKKKYIEQFEILKVESQEQTVHRVEEEPIPLWKDYLRKCRAIFGIDSKEYLIARFYDEFTVRDDLGLVLADDTRDDNYLFVRPDYLEVVINSYKTDKKYGQIRYKLKGSLEKLTRDYITKHNLKIGDLLFAQPTLSPIVSKMNKELGYSSGVNLFRHMTTSEQLAKAKSAEQKVKLAEAMKHSPVVQVSYLRKKKLI